MADKKKGMLLPCLHCGETEARVQFCLDDGKTFACMECEATFTGGDIRNLWKLWQPILEWVDKMPTATEDN